MENKCVPRTEHCGKPLSRGQGYGVKSQNLTEDDIFKMYEIIHVRVLPLIPIISSLGIIISWLSESNAQ